MSYSSQVVETYPCGCCDVSVNYAGTEDKIRKFCANHFFDHVTSNRKLRWVSNDYKGGCADQAAPRDRAYQDEMRRG